MKILILYHFVFHCSHCYCVSVTTFIKLNGSRRNKHLCVQSILAYNGAAIIAMTGKDCVAIAADRRFGVQAQTVSMDFEKVFEMGPHLFIGLPGLATDVQTV